MITDGIWIDPERLKKQAFTLRESAVSLASLSRGMEEQLSHLERIWMGGDADVGIGRGETLKEDLKNCAEAFLELSDSMKQIARQSEEAEKTASRIVSH